MNRLIQMCALILLVVAALSCGCKAEERLDITGEIEVGGIWLKGSLTQRNRDQFKVVYRKGGQNYEEWITPNRWRLQPPPSYAEEILVYSDGGWTTARVVKTEGERRLVRVGAQPERWFESRFWRPHPQEHHAEIGQVVSVQSGGHWYRSIILQKLPGVLLVRYEGYPESYVEWVGTERWKYITTLPAPVQNLSVGDMVLAYSDKHWFDAKILKVAPGRIQVRFEGYGERYDQWLTPDRWKVDNEPLPLDLPDLQPRMKVQALSNGNWYRATVLKVERDRALVRFDEFGERYDAWLTESRLKPALPPPAPVIVAGQRLEVYSNEIWYPATAVKVDDEDAFVHYEGFEDHHNEWVGSERWRLAGTLPNPLRQPVIGQRVLALYKNTWLPATVRGVEPDRVLISYDGYAEKYNIWTLREGWRFNEGAQQISLGLPAQANGAKIYVQTAEGWVPAQVLYEEGTRRLVRLANGREAWFGPGEWRETLLKTTIVRTIQIEPKMSVQVLRSGKWYRATVLEVEKERFLVNYDSFRNRPEWVTFDRIRLPSSQP